MFYNTINAKGFTLFDLKERGLKLEDLIVEYFTFGDLTPFEVFHLLERDGYKYPITSVRRAITELTGRGILEKTEETKMGDYGVINYIWKLKQ